MIPLNSSSLTRRNFAVKVARWHLSGPQNPQQKADSHPDFAHFVEAIVCALQKIQRLSDLKGSWSARRVRDETWALQQSYRVRLAGVLIVSHWAGRFQQRLNRIEADKIAALAKQVVGQSEPVHTKLIPHGSAGVRKVFRFGVVRHVQQMIFSWILQALLPASEHNFLLPGKRGIHGAAEEIGDWIAQSYRIWSVWDLKSAYPSISMDHLRLLCDLDERLVKHIAFPELPYQSNSIEFGSNYNTAEAAQRQLPQGAAHSSLILSALIDGCLKELPLGKIKIVTLADNGAFGAHTEQEAHDAMEALAKALAQHPAGPLFLHEQAICDGHSHSGWEKGPDGLIRQGAVDFCGYRVSYDVPNSEIRFRPSPKAFAKIRKRLRQNILQPGMPFEELELRGYVELRRWAKSFPLWKHRPQTDELLRISAQQEAIAVNQEWSGKAKTGAP